MTTTTPHHRSEAGEGAAGGLVVLAAVMLFVAGVLDLLRGIMAIAEDDVYVATPNYLFKFDLTSWGWIQLVLGAIAVLVSMGLFDPRHVGAGRRGGHGGTADHRQLPVDPVLPLLVAHPDRAVRLRHLGPVRRAAGRLREGARRSGLW